MKKILFSLATMALALTATAQTEHMNSFRNLGIGVEAGLMGAGVQVSVPVVTNHLVLVVGYNLPEFTYSTDFDFDAKDLNTEIDKLNKSVSLANQAGGNFTPVSRISQDEITVSADATINWGNIKAMLEWYPSSYRTFHFTFGAMIGQDQQFLKFSGVADPSTQAAYSSALKLERQMKSSQFSALVENVDIQSSLRYNIDETTYGLGENCAIDAAVEIEKIKPYFGIGFGRSIPNKRLGMQFELGAWYHGTPKIISSNELSTYDPSADGFDGVGDILSKAQIFPQLTIRITGRIF